MKKISEEPLFKNYLKLNSQTLETKSGEQVKFDILKRGKAVSGLVYDLDKGKFILVKQYRPAMSDQMTEIVAGLVDDTDISLEDALKREIMEEIGYKVKDMIYITDFFSSPGSSDENTFVYYCTANKVSEGGGLKDENEEIEIIELTYRELLETRFFDAKTMIAINFVKDQVLSKISGGK